MPNTRHQQVILRTNNFKIRRQFSFPEKSGSSKDLSYQHMANLHKYIYKVFPIILIGHGYANPQSMQSHQVDILLSRKDHSSQMRLWDFIFFLIFNYYYLFFLNAASKLTAL